jgi:hypothetical protein
MLSFNYSKFAQWTVAFVSQWRSSWIRPQIQYPSLHYRYAYDIANVLELKTIGLYAQSGRVRWRKSYSVVAAAIALAPLGLALTLTGTDLARPPRHLTGGYFGWLVYFFFLTLFEIVVSLTGVTVFHNLTDHLEKVLTQRGRDTYDRWANLTTSNGPQLAFAIIFAGVACVALWVASSVHGMNSRLYIALPSYLAVAICSYFISQGAYWVVTGTFLSILLTQANQMEPSWYAPAYTPGIELLARCYRLAFYSASLGVALCLFPLLTWVYKSPDSGPLLVVKIGLFVASVTTALIIAIIPQWRLSMVVANQRRGAIEQLEALLPSDVNSFVSGKQSDPVILSWLQLVSASPSSTVQNSTIAGIFLGLATAVLPYIVRLIA